MKTTTGKQTSSANEARYSDLKRMLEERRKEILSEVQGRIRDQREADAWGKVNEVLDAGESSEADIQEDIEFALIQMKAETLTKVNDALHRLEVGNVRLLRGLRRRNLGQAPPCAAVRGAVQGLRRGPGDGGRTRKGGRPEAQRSVVLLRRHVKLIRRPF